jgi:uncharacterized protein
MALFGKDFRNAKSHWLYPQQPLQYFWRGLGLFALIAFVDLVAQSLGGYFAYAALYQRGFVQFFRDGSVGAPEALKASIVGMTPAAVLVILCAVYFMKFGKPDRQGGLPLEWPKLGILGWMVLVLSFAALMYGVFIGIFAALGIDPQTYSPGGGLKDGSSSSGLVEKTVAELAHEPLLFVLALPGLFFAAPATEELLFRGYLFSAIVNTKLGRVGAVLITSSLWALVHLTSAPWLFVGVIFVMGLLLGVLLLRFGSLWVTIACHATWNLLNSLAIFGVGSHS